MRELMSWDELLMLGNRQSGTQTAELQQETGCSCIHCDRHNIYLKYCIMYSPSSGGSHIVLGSHYEYNCVKCVNGWWGYIVPTVFDKINIERFQTKIKSDCL